jgi:pyruvate dehydrogenase E1 component alpha subunit
MDLDKTELLQAWEKMVRIRKFEDRTGQEFAAGKMPGFVHLYAGEEAVAVGVCSHLSDRDFITSTHRGHGHCIAKGCDVKYMMAELFGRATGYCKGKGGSMHIADIEKGILGANGIVGAGMPLACGPALMAKVKGTDQVTVCFFGDGASNQGTFHESVNLSSIWKLPVVYVVENNGYAQSTPQDYHQNVDDIAVRAQAYNVPGISVDGMDFFAVHEAAGEAIKRARQGKGPTLVECKTYRYYGHFQGDAMAYRTKEEMEDFKQNRDCLNIFRKAVTSRDLATDQELDEIESKISEEIERAVEFAEESKYPEPEETLKDVYVEY